jgi:hypothetical protein
MNTIAGEAFLGVYDQQGEKPGADWQSKVLTASFQYRAIQNCISGSSLYGTQLSKHHEMYAQSYLTSEYFRKAMLELYGDSQDRLIDVIALDGDADIKAQVNGNATLSTPDFLVIFKKHVLPLDAKVSPDALNLSSRQISHGNTEDAVEASQILQEILAQKIQRSNIKFMRGKFILPNRTRFKAYLNPDDRGTPSGNFYTQRIRNLQNKKVADEWRDAILCPSGIVLPSYVPFVNLTAYKLDIIGSTPQQLSLLANIIVNDNLRERVPALKRADRVTVKTVFDTEEITQTITLALLALNKSPEAAYTYIQDFFLDNPDITTVSALTEFLYKQYYYLAYELNTQLNTNLLEAITHQLLLKRLPAHLHSISDQKGDLKPSSIKCFKKDVSTRGIKKQIENKVWELYKKGDITVSNYQAEITKLIGQAAISVANEVSLKREKFDSSNFALNSKK